MLIRAHITQEKGNNQLQIAILSYLRFGGGGGGGRQGMKRTCEVLTQEYRLTKELIIGIQNIGIQNATLLPTLRHYITKGLFSRLPFIKYMSGFQQKIKRYTKRQKHSLKRHNKH